MAADSPWKGARLALIVVAAGLVVAWLGTRGPADLRAAQAVAARTNGPLVVLGLVVLPLVGVPVSFMHAVTGARFGLPWGMAFVGVSLLVQLAASRLVVRAAPGFFARRFGWLRRRLPPATHRSFALFTLLLPGAPFCAQNYVLAIARVPPRIYYGYSFPLHFARSLLGVVFGGWSEDLTPARMAVVATYAVCVTVACGLAFRRLQSRWQSRPPAAGGPTPRG